MTMYFQKRKKREKMSLKAFHDAGLEKCLTI